MNPPQRSAAILQQLRDERDLRGLQLPPRALQSGPSTQVA
jgi:hypothetical protein